MGVLSDAAAAILAADGHGTLMTDVWSDYEPDQPDTVTVCREIDGLPAAQALDGLPTVVYGTVQAFTRAAAGQPDAAQARGLDAYRKLGIVAARQVTVAGVTLTVTFNARGLPQFVSDDEEDRPLYVVNFNVLATGIE